MTENNQSNLKQKLIKYSLIFFVLCAVIYASSQLLFGNKLLKKPYELGLKDNDVVLNQEEIAQEIAINEIKERGADFIYENILKQDRKIQDLENQLNEVKKEVLNKKNQDKAVRIALFYLQLRERLFSNQDFDNQLQSFEIIASTDKFLVEQIDKMKNILQKTKYSDQKIKETFDSLVPKIVSAQYQNENSGIIAKIYYNISKLISVRRVKENGSGDVDDIIIRAENFINQKKYRYSLTELLKLDSHTHEILQNFLNDLDNMAQIQEIDSKISDYLKYSYND